MSIIRFRVKSIDGPHDRGSLNQFHDYVVEVETDPGAPSKSQSSKIVVTLFDTAFLAVTEGTGNSSPDTAAAKAQLAHYVSERLKAILAEPSLEIPDKITVPQEDVPDLRQIDPNKVDLDAWHQVPSTPPTLKRRVFISCGQQTEHERTLGTRIKALVDEQPGLEGYFAQNQRSLDGVTDNIFKAIHNASGFIAVMHQRDQLPSGNSHFRGSVWVEQEIAIAAFLAQALGRNLPSRVYVQSGIRREGVRGYILLNPIEFSTSEDIITDLDTFWPLLVEERPQ